MTGEGLQAPRKLFTRDALRRAAVTLAALLLFYAGSYVPAPGFDAALLADLFKSSYPNEALIRMSLFALGLGPLLTVLILAEIFKIAAPGFVNWEALEPAAERRYGRALVAMALLVAALQSLGIARALEDVSGHPHPFVAEPGWTFRLTFVLSLTAGTALLIWLADQVTRHGMGSGFWLLYLAPVVSGLAALPALLAERLGSGQMTHGDILRYGVSVALAVAALVTLARRIEREVGERSRPEIARTLIWPPVIALTLYGYANALSQLFRQWRQAVDVTPHLLEYGTLASALLIAALVFFFTLAMSRAPRPIAYIAAAATTAICLTFGYWIGRNQLFEFEGGWLAAMTMVTLVALPSPLSTYVLFDGPAPSDTDSAPI